MASPLQQKQKPFVDSRDPGGREGGRERSSSELLGQDQSTLPVGGGQPGTRRS